MKKVLSLIVIAAMALSLAGCGGSGTQATTAGTEAKAGTEKQSEEKEAPAAEGGEILIGCLQDITGSTSALGMSVQAGAQAAVDEINANGGINGKTLKMNTYDTKGDVTEAVNAYITAVTVDQVKLIVGPPVANIANAIKSPLKAMTSPLWAWPWIRPAS